jgi:hypothetical protein
METLEYGTRRRGNAAKQHDVTVKGGKENMA